MKALATTAAAALAAALGVLAWRRRRRTALVTCTSTPPPHPKWKPGDPQPLPWAEQGFVALEPSKLASCYPLMISAYVPRPIAFISSRSSSSCAGTFSM